MAFPVAVPLIHEVERQLCRVLPMDLRVRLHRGNGGSIRADGESWSLFPVLDPTDRRRLGRTANHIVRETCLAHERAGFPTGAVAIADDGGGNYLILRCGSDEVELWDHETGESWPVNVAWD